VFSDQQVRHAEPRAGRERYRRRANDGGITPFITGRTDVTETLLTKVLLAAALAVAGAMPAVFAQESRSASGGARGEAAPTVSSSQVIGAQAADEWLASQLRGTAVVGSDGRRIGEVVDILLNLNGQARALVVGMGGVMGLGAKEIAIDLGQFREIPAPSSSGARAELKVPLTMDQLAAVPEFQPLPVPDAKTTGTAPQ
jgi:sporulation protein YlmC with PRC-barrel domain